MAEPVVDLGFDQHCGASDEDYRRMLAELLPTGPVWPRDPDSTLQRLLLAFGADLARAHNRGCDLIRESVPSDATELLPDWERVVGPDPCAPSGPSSLDGRRRRVVARLNYRGGQSIRIFRDLAKVSFGIELCFAEFRPFRAGPNGPTPGLVTGRRLQSEFYGHAGARLTNNDWRFAWSLCLCNPDAVPIGAREIKFRAGARLGNGESGGLGCAGDPLRLWEDNLLWLLCLIERAKPAHSLLLWDVMCPDPMEAFKYAPD